MGLRIKEFSSFNWMINVIITVIKYNIYSKAASKNQKKILPRYHVSKEKEYRLRCNVGAEQDFLLFTDTAIRFDSFLVQNDTHTLVFLPN